MRRITYTALDRDGNGVRFMSGVKQQLRDFLVDQARLVQNANIGNCEHTSRQMIRGAHRFAITWRHPDFDPVEFCDHADELALAIRGLKRIESGTPEEIRVKRQCLEILRAMSYMDPPNEQASPEVSDTELQKRSQSG